MHKCGLDGTIAAIATPAGEGGIGIVRLSGPEALAIADRIFISKDGNKPSTFKTYTTHYGLIKAGDEIVDEVILTVMRAPKSYTKEDVVEINCHGGIIALRRTLELALENDARLAEPGEFTKRAFLNGRIDLAQAEAVLDIIRAKTDSALRLGAEQLSGALSNEIGNIRRTLLDVLAILEANIDFPQEETGVVSLRETEKLNGVQSALKAMLESFSFGRVMREGIRAVICGKPNVGKSSLLNALLKQERSIVTPVPGTTRDTIEEIIDIRGIPVRIVDTAGILEPRDLVERKAVERSKKYIASADLVILIFDASRRISKEDRLLIRKLRNKTVLAVLNKIDLKSKIEIEEIRKAYPRLIGISAKKSKNIGLLEEEVAGLVYHGKVRRGEPLIVSNLRHIEKLKACQKSLAEARESLDNKLPLEFIAQSFKESLGYLDELIGKKFSEDLLDKIFGEFCIGK